MAIPPIKSEPVVYKPNSLPPTSSTSAKTQSISIEKPGSPSSSHVITVIHPSQDLRFLDPLLEEDSLAHTNSEVVLNEEKPLSEISVDKTQSIFERFCCFCRK
ncbi:MAG: hypothetical protein ACH349_01285 [Candidatus Rhabdochlamydia sp.]|jgi:exosome complex RNA-binding protein Rrp42 (RNase PH superfamily)|nr:hypothetical protein [Chlamydiota bacterium]